MRDLSNEENLEEARFKEETIEVAKKATCDRSKCGSIVVKDGEIIGEGFNSPPKGLKTQRRCLNHKGSYDVKVTDKTCCVHAEQRAIMDALKRNPNKIEGSRIYFIHLDKDRKPVNAKEPYCTICSKMALDAGIKEFALFGEKGVSVYDTEEYNDLSYDYKKKEE